MPFVIKMRSYLVCHKRLDVEDINVLGFVTVFEDIL